MCRSSLHEGNAVQVCGTHNPRLLSTELLQETSSNCKNHTYATTPTRYMTNGESNFSKSPSSKSLSMLCDMLISNNTRLTNDQANMLTTTSHPDHDTCTKDEIMLIPTTSTKNSKKKKQVSIHMQVHLRLIIARHDMSPDEYSATWYSPEEYAKITESCCKEITMLNRGELLKDKKYCARGLETHMKTRSRAKSMTRSLACHVVLQEQDRQWREGIRHDDALAYVYHSASASCQLWANVVGLEDQKEAEITYDDLEHHDDPSPR